MGEQTFLDSLNQSMLDSARQVRLSLGRPSSQATRQQALEQVAMLQAAKEAAQAVNRPTAGTTHRAVIRDNDFWILSYHPTTEEDDKRMIGCEHVDDNFFGQVKNIMYFCKLL